MIGIRTIRQGERVAVWNRAGRMRLVDGPTRLWLLGQSVQPLPRFSAEADEYLIVRYRSGHAEHIPGPAAVWLDPVEHEAITVEKATAVSAHEAVVVYRRTGAGVERRVERGPLLFVPTENEWLHAFAWHGADPKQPTRKIPRALRFTRLRVIPDQMYVDVEDVRTADDALLVVRLMVFFELVDIERMLDQTHDPIADFLNAVSADVVEFAGSRGFEQLKQDTEQLNELAVYANLTRRAEGIGYRINKVVYRGYEASAKLQAMHDSAIEARTHLRLESETERQAQELADLKLQREAERARTQRRVEQDQAEHERTLERMQHEQRLQEQRDRQQARLEGRRQLNAARIEHLRAKNQEQASFLGSIQAMQVDLTRYLVAQYQHPDRLIRIAGDEPPRLHVHE